MKQNFRFGPLVNIRALLEEGTEEFNEAILDIAENVSIDKVYQNYNPETGKVTFMISVEMDELSRSRLQAYHRISELENSIAESMSSVIYESIITNQTRDNQKITKRLIFTFSILHYWVIYLRNKVQEHSTTEFFQSQFDKYVHAFRKLEQFRFLFNKHPDQNSLDSYVNETFHPNTPSDNYVLYDNYQNHHSRLMESVFKQVTRERYADTFSIIIRIILMRIGAEKFDSPSVDLIREGIRTCPSKKDFIKMVNWVQQNHAQIKDVSDMENFLSSLEDIITNE